MKSLSLALLTAILLVFTLPPFNLTWLAGFALVPLILSVFQPRHFLMYFLSGVLAALPYYAYGLYWVAYYDIRIYLAVVLWQLLFTGLFAGLTGFSLKKAGGSPFAGFLLPPVIWIILSLPFHWSPLAAVGTQAMFYQALEFMQMARHTGVYGVVLLLLLLNSSIALCIQRKEKASWAFLSVALLLCGLNFLWGRSVMKPVSWTHSVAVIQHNFSPSKEWWMKNQRQIAEEYRTLALEAAAKKPELIVFPSYSLPFDAYRQPQFFESLAKETETHILVASYIPRVEGQRIADVGQYEMALLFSPEGKLEGVDAAVQGPPLRNIGEVYSEKTNPISSALGKLGVLLCYEDVIPRLARQEAAKGADLLIAMSNPGFFTETFMPEAHLYQDQLRAIETGLFVIRVSANGYSALIDPRGQVLHRSELDKKQVLFV